MSRSHLPPGVRRAPWSASLLCALLAGAAPGAVADDNPSHCYNSRESESGGVRPRFAEECKAIDAEPDPGRRLEALAVLQEKARSPAERALVGMRRGSLLEAVGRQAEGLAVLAGIADDPRIPRLIVDRIRGHLAEVAAAQRDWPAVIAELEPIFAAGCSTMPQGGKHLLAMAYLETRRPADALAVLDWASGEAPALKDGDWWTGVQVELRCKLKGPVACVRAVAHVAESGGVSEALGAVMNELLARLKEEPQAAAALLAARAQGLIDDSARIVPRPAAVIADLVPIDRVAPRFPVEAARRGVTGLVKLMVTVGTDGKVTDVDVLYALPRGYFESSAVRAASRSTFEPRKVNGVPVEMTGVYTIRYELAP